MPLDSNHIPTKCVWLASALPWLFGLGVTVIAVLGVGACGGSSSSSVAGLKSYLIQGNKETGYAIQLPLEHYKTAAGYATSEQNPADAQRLARAGFQQALVADGFVARPVAGQGDANSLFREGRCVRAERAQ